MTPKLRGLSKESPLDFHGGTEDKNLRSSVGVTGSIPGPGRFRMLRSNSHATGACVLPGPQATATGPNTCAPQREPAQPEARPPRQRGAPDRRN